MHLVRRYTWTIERDPLIIRVVPAKELIPLLVRLIALFVVHAECNVHHGQHESLVLPRLQPDNGGGVPELGRVIAINPVADLQLRSKVRLTALAFAGICQIFGVHRDFAVIDGRILQETELHARRLFLRARDFFDNFSPGPAAALE